MPLGRWAGRWVRSVARCRKGFGEARHALAQANVLQQRAAASEQAQKLAAEVHQTVGEKMTSVVEAWTLQAGQVHVKV